MAGDKLIKCSMKRLVAYANRWDDCMKDAAGLTLRQKKMVPVCGTHARQMLGKDWRELLKPLSGRKP